jgi:hypothetical protein
MERNAALSRNKEAPQTALKYPTSVVIPRDVLALQYLKDNLKNL